MALQRSYIPSQGSWPAASHVLGPAVQLARDGIFTVLEMPKSLTVE